MFQLFLSELSLSHFLFLLWCPSGPISGEAVSAFIVTSQGTIYPCKKVSQRERAPEVVSSSTEEIFKLPCLLAKETH